MATKEIELLPHQYDLITDTQHKVMGLASGYGGGKTFIGTYKHVYLMTLNPGVDSIFAEPTYPLIIQLAVPALKEALKALGIPFKYKKSDQMFECIVAGQETRLLLCSMENYERLIGVNASHVTLDEFDTTKAEIAYKAFEKLLGRLRAGNVRQLNIVSTPEGFRAMYQIFVADVRKKPSLKKQRRLIKAKSTDNPHLPEDFIETMFAGYDDKLVEAYVNGEFVNLKSGVVYHQYDTALNRSYAVIEPGETLHIGQDFNVGKMASVVFVDRWMNLDVASVVWNEAKGDYDTVIEKHPFRTFHAVDEIADGFDTEATIKELQYRYQQGKPGSDTYHHIRMYPDASGRNRKSVNASTTDIALLEAAGFEIRADLANPPVKDRINAVNAFFKNASGQRRLYVNEDKCPELVDCLRRQSWDAKTGEPEKGGENDPSHMNDAFGYPIVHEFPIVRPLTDDLEFNTY